MTIFINEQVLFVNATGYLIEMRVKPLMLVLFALLVAAAVARSRASEKLLVPFIISIWVMVAAVLGLRPRT